MNREKLNFLLKTVECKLPYYIDDVLKDSAEEPSYSAIYTSNLIECVIEILSCFGEDISFHDYKSYISFSGFSKADVKLFEYKRTIELESHLDKQISMYSKRKLKRYHE